jgi:hypothetical protein
MRLALRGRLMPGLRTAGWCVGLEGGRRVGAWRVLRFFWRGEFAERPKKDTEFTEQGGRLWRELIFRGRSAGSFVRIGSVGRCWGAVWG